MNELFLKLDMVKEWETDADLYISCFIVEVFNLISYS